MSKKNSKLNPDSPNFVSTTPNHIRELENLNEKYKNTIYNNLSEIAYFKGVISEYERIKKMDKERIYEKEGHIGRLYFDIDKLEKTIIVKDTEYSELKKENARLNNIIDEKNKKNSELLKENEELKSFNKDISSDIINNEINSIIKEKDKKIAEYEAGIINFYNTNVEKDKLIEFNNKKTDELNSMYIQMNNMYNTIFNDNNLLVERYNNLLTNYNKKIDWYDELSTKFEELKNHYIELDNKKKSEHAEFIKLYITVTNENKILKQRVQELELCNNKEIFEKDKQNLINSYNKVLGVFHQIYVTNSNNMNIDNKENIPPKKYKQVMNPEDEIDE